MYITKSNYKILPLTKNVWSEQKRPLHFCTSRIHLRLTKQYTKNQCVAGLLLLGVIIMLNCRCLHRLARPSAWCCFYSADARPILELGSPPPPSRRPVPLARVLDTANIMELSVATRPCPLTSAAPWLSHFFSRRQPRNLRLERGIDQIGNYGFSEAGEAPNREQFRPYGPRHWSFSEEFRFLNSCTVMG
jgi:hypothetical protein